MKTRVELIPCSLEPKARLKLTHTKGEERAFLTLENTSSAPSHGVRLEAVVLDRDGIEALIACLQKALK